MDINQHDEDEYESEFRSEIEYLMEDRKAAMDLVRRSKDPICKHLIAFEASLPFYNAGESGWPLACEFMLGTGFIARDEEEGEW